MIRTMTVRLYPTKSQEARLNEYLEVGRRVYNHALEHRIKAYKRRGEYVNYNQQAGNITKWRGNNGCMNRIPQRVMINAIRRLDLAYKGFTSKRCKRPRFKSRSRWKSFEILSDINYVEQNKIRVPKLGLVRCRNLRPIEGKQKGMQVVRRAGKWFAAILFDDGKTAPPKKPIETATGIDMGLTHFTVSSDGVKIAAPKHFAKLERKLKQVQRRVSRKKRGSKNRRKAVHKLQRVHTKIADARSDFTHKLSKVYANSYDLIAVEKLNIGGMVRGRLAKSILDAGWYQFKTRLRYKAESAGATFVEVDPKGTSQECSQCGQIVKKTLAVRTHKCSCGCVLDRDHNAAINILKRGLNTVGETEINACGLEGSGRAISAVKPYQTEAGTLAAMTS